MIYKIILFAKVVGIATSDGDIGML